MSLHVCVNCSHTIVSHILTCEVDGSPVPFSELVPIIADSQPTAIEAHFNQTSYCIVHCAIAIGGGADGRINKPGGPISTFWKGKKQAHLVT